MKLQKAYMEFYWRITNLVKSILYILMSSQQKNIIKKNADIKNKYQGKRCFIAMGGPSLKEIDTAKLRDEYVMGANNGYLSPQWEEMQPQFLCSIDPLIISQNRRDIVGFMKKNPQMKFFAALKDKEVLDRAGVNNVYYSAGRRVQYREFQSVEFEKARETLSGNILNYCIKRAIHLGFKEIYLLGCDFTLFNGKVTNHCYEEKGEEVTKSQAELYREGAFVLEDLYSLKRFADRNHITIKIAGGQSLIDTFEFVDYESLFI